MDKTYTQAKDVLDRISRNTDEWVDDGYGSRSTDRWKTQAGMLEIVTNCYEFVLLSPLKWLAARVI